MKIIDRLRSLFWSPEIEAARIDQKRSQESDEDPIDHSVAQRLSELYSRSVMLQGDRRSRYADYDEMDEVSPEVGVALDIWADESTTRDSKKNDTVWAEATEDSVADLAREKREKIATIVNNMLSSIHTEDVIWAHARNMSKYGDLFIKVIYKEGTGIDSTKLVSDPSKVTRVVDSRGKLVGFKEEDPTLQQETENLRKQGYNQRDPDIADEDGLNPPVAANEVLSPWDYVHFRILGSLGQGHYGDSMIEAARGPWKRLRLLEDALAIYRLTRGPDRTVYNIDVGNQDYGEAVKTLKKWKKVFKKNRYINKTSGKFERYYNPMSLDEDIFFPIRKGSESRIERLSGGADVRSIADVEHFENKLYTALKIPRPYITGEVQGGGLRPDQILQMQDVKFANAVNRIKRAIITGYERLAQIHLALTGQPRSLKNFKIQMDIISATAEKMRNEVLRGRIEVADQFVRLAQQLNLDKQGVTRYVRDELLMISPSMVEEYGLKFVKSEDGDQGGGGGGGFFASVDANGSHSDQLLEIAKLVQEINENEKAA